MKVLTQDEIKSVSGGIAPVVVVAIASVARTAIRTAGAVAAVYMATKSDDSDCK